AGIGRDDVADGCERHRLRVNTSACDRLLDHHRAEVRRLHVLQRATKTTDGGTNSTQNNDFTICHNPLPCCEIKTCHRPTQPAAASRTSRNKHTSSARQTRPTVLCM